MAAVINNPVADELVEAADEPAGAIAEFNRTEAGLASLRKKYATTTWDVSTIKGLDACRAARAEIRDLRIALEAKRTELKAPILERGRLLDSEAKRITAELTALESPIDAVIKAEEERREAEKQKRIEEERVRVAAIRERITSIATAPADAAGKPASYIAELIFAFRAITDFSGFAEFAIEAQSVHEEVLSKLDGMHAAVEAQEIEAARLAAQRQELDRQRAENERLAEEAQQRLVAEQEAQRERLAQEAAVAQALRDEEDRRAAAKRAEQDRVAAEARRVADEIDAKERAEKAERDRLAREEEERRVAAERAELKRQQDLIDAENARLAEAQRVLDAQAEEERQAEAERQLAIQRATAEERHAAMYGLTHYIVVVDWDVDIAKDPNFSRSGPLAFETYLNEESANLDSVKQRAQSLGRSYGSARIAQLVFIDA